MFRRWWRLLLPFTFACAFGEQSLEELDPDAIPENPTYEEHIAPMFEFYCTACHGASSVIAGDAILLSEPDVQSECLDIFTQVFGVRAMPPAAARRLSSRDEAILLRYLRALEEDPILDLTCVIE